VRVFSDVHAGEPYGEHEDWYVYPDLVDMDYINRIKTDKVMRRDEIIQHLNNFT
jgi:hypothetical protein